MVGSRRLLTYRRLCDENVKELAIAKPKDSANGVRADDLNNFRKRVLCALIIDFQSH